MVHSSRILDQGADISECPAKMENGPPPFERKPAPRSSSATNVRFRTIHRNLWSELHVAVDPQLSVGAGNTDMRDLADGLAPWDWFDAEVVLFTAPGQRSAPRSLAKVSGTSRRNCGRHTTSRPATAAAAPLGTGGQTRRQLSDSGSADSATRPKLSAHSAPERTAA